jgi:hypothetical protein
VAWVAAGAVQMRISCKPVQPRFNLKRNPLVAINIDKIPSSQFRGWGVGGVWVWRFLTNPLPHRGRLMTVEPPRSKRRFIGMSDGMYENKTRWKARHCSVSGGQGGLNYIH